jgi:hypothetical protein
VPGRVELGSPADRQVNNIKEQSLFDKPGPGRVVWQCSAVQGRGGKGNPRQTMTERVGSTENQRHSLNVTCGCSSNGGESQMA